MHAALPVDGVIHHYAWGDTTFLPHLLGRQPDGLPWAELWLGTHPNGPSTVEGRPLAELTGPLPYLLKVLAAAEPLSMQCHPDAERALTGHAEGVYPDPNAKPELLLALTPFRALCGVRPVDRTLELLRGCGASTLADNLVEHGVHGTLERLYRGGLDHSGDVAAVLARGGEDLAYVAELEGRYPGDPSVAVAILLNHVELAPGDALHLAAGNLHAYLRGSGVELMGPSDNVVRGGLTPKFVDVDELLRIVDPTPLDDPVMNVRDGRYRLPEAGVALVRVDPGTTHRSHGHELAVALDGTAWYLPDGAEWRPTVAGYVVIAE